MKIGFTGDVAFSKYFKDGFKNDGIVSDKIKEYLIDTDYTVVNVEAPITNSDVKLKKPLVHTNGVGCVDFFKKINGTVWNLANNHSLDCGVDGLRDTQKYAKKSGVLTVGAGENSEQARKPLVFDDGDVKVGIISVAGGTAVIATKDDAGCNDWDGKSLKSDIRALKSACDYVVIIVHGGEEFSPLPLPYARNRYKRYHKWGADAVVAHHPHVPQNYETFGDKIIFYSLGNFIFDTDYQRAQKHTDIGVLVRLNFEKSGLKWDSLSIKIDRETQSVKETAPLAVFCDVDKKTYKRLLPLNEKVYSENLYIKYNFIGKRKELSSRIRFFMSKLERFKFTERFALIKAMLLRRIKRYKKCDESLAIYILGASARRAR